MCVCVEGGGGYTKRCRTYLILVHIGLTWRPIYTKLRSNFIDFFNNRKIIGTGQNVESVKFYNFYLEHFPYDICSLDYFVMLYQLVRLYSVRSDVLG